MSKKWKIINTILALINIIAMLLVIITQKIVICPALGVIGQIIILILTWKE